MTDRQNRIGNAKAGQAQAASSQDANIELRERLRKLALETIDLRKDPYFLKNHLGTYECRLCLTLHSNEGSYLAHTQGKKHQSNLARRQAKDAKENIQSADSSNPNKKLIPKPKTIKIGRPGYKVVKSKNPQSGQKQVMFEIEYSEITGDDEPRYRIMNAHEQKVEIPEKHYQYVVFSGDPYENIAFKVPNMQIDQNAMEVKWNKNSKHYTVKIAFKERHVGRLHQENSRYQQDHDNKY